MTMISVIEKMMNTCGASQDFRVISVGKNNLYVEGIKNVVTLQAQEISFQTKHCVIIITGTDLCVKYLDKTTSHITGNICKIEYK